MIGRLIFLTVPLTYAIHQIRDMSWEISGARGSKFHTQDWRRELPRGFAFVGDGGLELKFVVLRFPDFNIKIGLIRRLHNSHLPN